MSNPITINPAEVAALSEQDKKAVREIVDARARRLGASGNQARPLNAQEVISMTSEPYRPTGNQARLNSGCICDSGCESCARLAEAFEALRDSLAWMKDNAENIQRHPELYQHSLSHHVQEARAALALAARVKA